jgi:hypothetical protein
MMVASTTADKKLIGELVVAGRDTSEALPSVGFGGDAPSFARA